MWPMSSNELNYVAYVKTISQTAYSTAASIVVQTTITGYSVHTI